MNAIARAIQKKKTTYFKKVSKNTDPTFNQHLLDLIEQYKGTGGDADAESVIIANKRDITDGYVRVSSSNKDVAHIAKRLSNHILEVTETKGQVQFLIDKKYFRGIKYAFKSDSIADEEQE